PDAGVVEQLECVPLSTSRCLCELREGVRQCDESGRLGPCVCEDPVVDDVCGDGIVQYGEACDDQNLVAGDGCSPTCLPDGRPPSVEQCPGQSVAIWPEV